MKRLLLSLTLVALLVRPALADTQATTWNAALAAQIADAVTTSVVVGRNGVVVGGCTRTGYERDPLARPFARSMAAGIGAAVVVNALGRLLFRRNKTAGLVLGGVEVVMVGNNARTIAVQNACR